MTACSSGTTTSSTADAGDDTASTAGDTSTAEGGETSGTSNVGGEIEWLQMCIRDRCSGRKLRCF